MVSTEERFSELRLEASKLNPNNIYSFTLGELKITKEMCNILFEEKNYIYYIFYFYYASMFWKKANAILGNGHCIGMANPLVTAELSFNPHPLTNEHNHSDDFQNRVKEAIKAINQKRGFQKELQAKLQKYFLSKQKIILDIFKITSGIIPSFSEENLKNKETLTKYENMLSGNREIVRLNNSWSVKDYNDYFNKEILPILEKH